MNDSEELRLAIAAMRRYVEARLRRITRRETREAVKSALDMATLSGFSAYVASFTEQGNLLSQWRAYAPRDGVSIGFLRSALERVPRFRLARCEYIEEDAFIRRPLPVRLAPVARDLDRCIERLARVRRRAGAPRAFLESVTDQRHRHTLSLVFCLLEHAIWMKHRGFAEEREWRLARYEPPYLFPREPAPDFRPRFRAGALGVTPYLAAALPPKHRGKPFGIARIVLGPSPNGEASASAVRSMLESRFKTPVPAGWCRLPYRGW